MNIRNCNRLGVNYTKRFTRLNPSSQIEDFDDDLGDLFTEPQPFDSPSSSPSSSSHSSPASPPEIKTLDTLETVINNNPLLTEDFLSGSLLVQCGVSPDMDLIFNEPLYEGSDLTLEDALLIIEMIKSTNNFGDTNESIVLGMLGSFMPKDNLIRKIMAEKSGSIYHFQKLMKKGLQHFQKSSVHKILVCKKGCTAFAGTNEMLNRCGKCNYRFNVLDNSNSNHMYYMPLKDRLISLLLSDLKNLFYYPILRSKTDSNFIQDTYDGSTWKYFEHQMNKGNGEMLIGLQWCWDGADAFTFSGKSFWPGCFSILNFPKDLRGKLHVGMHVTTLCAGTFN